METAELGNLVEILAPYLIPVGTELRRDRAGRRERAAAADRTDLGG